MSRYNIRVGNMVRRLITNADQRHTLGLTLEVISISDHPTMWGSMFKRCFCFLSDTTKEYIWNLRRVVGDEGVLELEQAVRDETNRQQRYGDR